MKKDAEKYQDEKKRRIRPTPPPKNQALSSPRLGLI